MEKNPHNSETELYPILKKITNVGDLRKLDINELPLVCDDIRKYLIDKCSTNPGHFASSMGAVEIIVALHYVFDTPADRIVFDVGHQAYAHKILTGRRDDFPNQRKLNGISGFPNPMESEYDTFVAGHAGNSISAALGMAIADMNTPGSENKHTVALIGDASISNGLAFEGLNNVSNNPNNLLIVLNDNNMSIDDNVGALHKYLSKVNTSKEYNLWRNKTYNFLKDHKLITESGRRTIIRFNNSIKSLVAKQQNIFEGLNIRYFGPFDGHNVIEIVRILQEIKDMKGPRILHLHTVKGKGYQFAEKDPTTWHAPGKFDKTTGHRISSSGKALPKWQDVFGDKIIDLARKHSDVMGITAAMPSGTSLAKLLHEMPHRAYDVGISEGHAVTFAGGMAAAGKHPYVVIYSSFLQRAYDNIIHDVTIQKLPVTFCIDRAGIVGEDGATHHGLLDLAYLRCIPNIDIAVPSDGTMLCQLMDYAHDYKAPMAIRYPRGSVSDDSFDSLHPEISRGKGYKVIDNKNAKIACLTVGPVIHDAVDAINNLSAQIPVDLYDMVWVKPLDTDLLDEIVGKYAAIITIEDGTVSGGFGSAVAEYLSTHQSHPLLKILGVDDTFLSHATVSELKHIVGIDNEGIENAIKEINDLLLAKIQS